MMLTDVSGDEYRLLFPSPTVVYNSVDFTELNAMKAESVRRVIICNDNDTPVLGLTFGKCQGQWRAPFSAPFASFDTRRNMRTQSLIDAAKVLRKALPGATLTLPPAIYSPRQIDRTFLALTTAGATTKHIDWNYHIDLLTPFKDNIDATAAKKLRRAEKTLFKLERCDAPRAYEIICRNRADKGYYLAMTLEQVMETTSNNGPIKGDFFVLSNGLTDIAAAVIFIVTDDIAQVIYWGDVACECCRHPMNLLAAQLCEHYAYRGFRILDIGPSGSMGIPSPGLCDFKESIGCIATPKPTLIL